MYVIGKEFLGQITRRIDRIGDQTASVGHQNPASLFQTKLVQEKKNSKSQSEGGAEPSPSTTHLSYTQISVRFEFHFIGPIST